MNHEAMAKKLAHHLSLLLASIETPGDLNQLEREDVILDAHNALDDYEDGIG